MRGEFGEIDAGGTSNIPTATSLLFFQALILSGITGLTARMFETLCRVPVKLAAPYIAFHNEQVQPDAFQQHFNALGVFILRGFCLVTKSLLST